MFKLSRLLLPLLFAVVCFSASGSAFQLFGDTPSRSQVFADEAQIPKLENKSGLKLSDKSQPQSDVVGGADIWIPGLGVVGKIPDFDFGLEMLYGNGDATEESPREGFEFAPQSDEFSVKGTIKRKF